MVILKKYFLNYNINVLNILNKIYVFNIFEIYII